MEVNFVNGAGEQHEVFSSVLGSLLHLDLDDFDLTLNVEFVADPSPGLHNEFAYTESSGGDADIRIRSDFPAFAPVQIWGSTRFANEVVAHELGHALLGRLTDNAREQIASMFDTTPDDWNSGGWEDRPLEGIVETFKDAFLPAALREFFNRTNHKIPIHQYPAFRALWRQELSNAGATDPVTGDPMLGVPAYSLDALRVNISHVAVTLRNLDGTPYAPSHGLALAAIYNPANYTSPNEGLSSYRPSLWGASRPIWSSLSYTGANARTGEQDQPPTSGLWLEPGSVHAQSIPFPDITFFEYDDLSALPFGGIVDESDLVGVDHSGDVGPEAGDVGWDVHIITTYFDTSIGAARVWDEFLGGYYLTTVLVSGTPTEVKLVRYGDCEGIGPGTTIEREVTIPTPEQLVLPDLAVEACGDPMIPIRIFGGLFTESEVNGASPFDIDDYRATWLPSMPVVQGAHPACGPTFEVPVGEASTGVARRTQIRTPDRVGGRRVRA